MRVLFDTVALYAAVGHSDIPFSPEVRHILKNPDTVCLLSTASIMEIAIKFRKKKTNMNQKLVEEAIANFDITVIPFSEKQAYSLFSLPHHHNDPFDRIMIAVALTEDVAIVTSDSEFRKYGGRVIW